MDYSGAFIGFTTLFVCAVQVGAGANLAGPARENAQEPPAAAGPVDISQGSANKKRGRPPGTTKGVLARRAKTAAEAANAGLLVPDNGAGVDEDEEDKGGSGDDGESKKRVKKVLFSMFS